MTEIHRGFADLIKKILSIDINLLPLMMNMLNISLNDFNIDQNSDLYIELEQCFKQRD